MKRMSLSDLLAPASADIDLIPVSAVLDRVKRTFSHAASAIVADIFVNLQDTIHHFSRAYRTVFLYRALFTSVAGIFIEIGNALSDDSQIVQIRFHTIIGTSAHGDLEFVGQLHLAVTHIKSFMDFFCEPT